MKMLENTVSSYCICWRLFIVDFQISEVNMMQSRGHIKKSHGFCRYVMIVLSSAIDMILDHRNTHSNWMIVT